MRVFVLDIIMDKNNLKKRFLTVSISSLIIFLIVIYMAFALNRGKQIEEKDFYLYKNSGHIYMDIDGEKKILIDDADDFSLQGKEIVKNIVYSNKDIYYDEHKLTNKQGIYGNKVTDLIVLRDKLNSLDYWINIKTNNFKEVDQYDAYQISENQQELLGVKKGKLYKTDISDLSTEILYDGAIEFVASRDFRIIYVLDRFGQVYAIRDKKKPKKLDIEDVKSINYIANYYLVCSDLEEDKIFFGFDSKKIEFDKKIKKIYSINNTPIILTYDGDLYKLVSKGLVLVDNQVQAIFKTDIDKGDWLCAKDNIKKDVLLCQKAETIKYMDNKARYRSIENLNTNKFMAGYVSKEPTLKVVENNGDISLLDFEEASLNKIAIKDKPKSIYLSEADYFIYLNDENKYKIYNKEVIKNLNIIYDSDIETYPTVIPFSSKDFFVISKDKVYHVDAKAQPKLIFEEDKIENIIYFKKNAYLYVVTKNKEIYIVNNYYNSPTLISENVVWYDNYNFEKLLFRTYSNKTYIVNGKNKDFITKKVNDFILSK